MKQAVIYIPGLGDERVAGQRRAINTWSWYGVKPELFQMHWTDEEPWDKKFERLLSRIDTLVGEGRQVAIVAASAGASAAINAYVSRRDVVNAVVLIAGKVNRANAIHPGLIRKNPSFGTSAFDSQEALASLTPDDRRRILSRYGIIDRVVTPADSHIPGARNRVVPSIGHFFTIASQLILGAPSFIHFIKKSRTS
jgi:pimeloyl-ACP methyl ester carboxylesterase